MLKQNILIVDDVPANIKVLQAALMFDYDLSAAMSGPDAIKIAIADAPDLILMDIMMPDMSGYEVCRRLKADPRTWNIPIIFITARSEEEEETKGFGLGAVDYITKPFSPAIVKARVGTQLELKRHRDHLEELNTLLMQEIAERKRTEASLRNLLKKQEINIGLAKKLLNLVNGTVPRDVRLSENLSLFIDAISIPCYAEGGDHYFVRTLGPNKHNRGGKTILSLKDQSGHEVTCVLRSIITDLMHHAILDNDDLATLEKSLSKLNNDICDSDIFSQDDFFTSVNAEIDHETLVIRYVSAGHPPLLLIRGSTVMELPKSGGTGANIPIPIRRGIEYSAGECQLRKGDQLILYTDGLTEMPLKNRKRMIKLDEFKCLVEDIACSSAPGFRIRGKKRRQGAGLPISDIMSKLLDRISRMSQEEVIPQNGKNGPKNTSADDITMVCLEIEDLDHYDEEVWTPRDADDIAKHIVRLHERLRAEWYPRESEFPDPCLRVVLEEALLNAWIHGNHRDSGKTITVRWRFGNDFHLEVIDQGHGFDYECVPDPTTRDNLTRPHGRGIFIIQHYASHISWKKGGRHLVTTFRKNMVSSKEALVR